MGFFYPRIFIFATIVVLHHYLSVKSVYYFVIPPAYYIPLPRCLVYISHRHPSVYMFFVSTISSTIKTVKYRKYIFQKSIVFCPFLLYVATSLHIKYNDGRSRASGYAYIHNLGSRQLCNFV